MKFLFTLMLCLATAVNAQNLTHSEMVGRPTDKSITIQAFFDADVDARIDYGTDRDALTFSTKVQTFKAGEPVEIVVDGLTQNTRYFYSLAYAAKGTKEFTARPVRTFVTARPKGRPFVFTIQADPHMDEQSDSLVYANCLKNQLSDAPDFMIDLGDILMSDKMQTASKQIPRDTVTYRAHMMRSFYEIACHSVPLFIALGNHEGEAGWLNSGNGNNVAVWGTVDRKKYFMNPAPDDFYTGDTTNHPDVGIRENYYRFEWGDALFIVLDPYWYTKPKPDSLNGWRWTLGKDQYNWLKRTLEESKATFKFIFAHQLVGGDPLGRGGVEFADRYEWGGQNLDGTPGFAQQRPGWYKPIKDLLKEHRVNVFFHGHDHFFAKQEKDCLIYQETPQPSHTSFSGTGTAAKYGYLEGLILPNSGHFRVSVTPESFKVEYIRAYNPKNETATRKNGDISATYVVNTKNCYDSISTSVPVLWNTDYIDEHIAPNPMRDQTSIRFTLPESDVISIQLFDAQGSIVRSVLRETAIDAGSYTVIWDGMQDNGTDSPSGSYTYKITSRHSAPSTGTIVRTR
jgi:phosphodiesterase/alkaline phosphatase D-like protein